MSIEIGKFRCECGSLILNREDNIIRHKNTKMHKRFMKQLKEQSKPKEKLIPLDDKQVKEMLEKMDEDHDYLDPKDKQYTIDILKGGDILLRLV